MLLFYLGRITSAGWNGEGDMMSMFKFPVSFPCQIEKLIELLSIECTSRR